MSKGVNKTIHIGRLGDDPDLRTTNGGTSVCNFSIAIDESYQRDGETVEKTEWVNVVAWAQLAEICAEYLSQGSQVYVEGSLTTSSWETDSGETRYSTEVKAREVTFLGGASSSKNSEPQSQRKPDTRQNAEPGGTAPANDQFEPDDSDSLPF